ncbi:hypothetical protein K504DRAFT_460127 [Pleomassaria siparia CBS 279.74]|uniref:Uncharacterized protein n=1 Tax=Pleomassaria siparia CBS 279.74 TaxID=1314801 RepID=A0A6G1JZW6_9PLEO|nr:hypothetical protein K504DRAFT_460127 [Pleomassaria siparia CBS 279.74]
MTSTTRRNGKPSLCEPCRKHETKSITIVLHQNAINASNLELWTNVTTIPPL